jgi:AmiR/NasT family two-component response regulator
MNTSLHTVRALLVSSSEAQTQRISALLTRAHIVPFDHAGSARQALEQFDAGGIDGVLIAEPIAGSSGRELALQLKKRHCMAVLLAAPEHADTDAALLEQSGVLVLPNDAPESLIVQTIRLLTAVRIQLEQMQHKTEKLEAKVADIRIINRAKLLLVQHLQMTETEAHKYIEKQAMDTSMRRRTIAENIIRTYED